MIIPIVRKIEGEDQTIGTASVTSDDNDVWVEFFLNPGFQLSDAVKKQLTRDLKKLAKERG